MRQVRAVRRAPSWSSRHDLRPCAGALLLLVLVAPAIARGWLSALVLVGLIVAGIEVVRIAALREAPRTVSDTGWLKTGAREFASYVRIEERSSQTGASPSSFASTAV